MIARWLAIVTTVILFLALVWHADPLAPDPITLSLSHTVAMWPASTFRVRAVIERHPDNRQLCLSANGPEYFNGCYQIDGAQRQRVFERYWENLVPGEYEAVAELTRVTAGKDVRHAAHVRFRVIGLF